MINGYKGHGMVGQISYEQMVEEFSWDNEFARTDWESHEELNVAHECCDRWADGSNQTMFHWADEEGSSETWSYDDLSRRSNQVANMLTDLGMDREDRVGIMLPRIPESVASQFGVWKAGGVNVPLFTAFGPDSLEYRLNDADVEYLITTPEYYGLLDDVGKHSLKNIVLVGGDEGDSSNTDTIDFESAVDAADEEFDTVRTDPDDPATIMYTSGTTGDPKGELWVHKFLTPLPHYVEYGWGVDEGDTVFCGADPAWAVGQAGLCTPAFLHASFVFYDGEFDPVRYFELLEQFDVDVFAHAPTAYRGMMAAGDAIDNFDITLDAANALGESTPPSVIEYFEEKWAVTVHDGYGFSEAMMVINNYNKVDMEIKPGSMGLPSPAFDADIIDEEGNRLGPGEEGEIAVRNDYGIFLTKEYLNLPEKTENTMESEWRRSGDIAKKDEDGYFWFQGRKDDIIVSSGYKISPDEVEDSVLQHEAVANVGVIGVPDEDRGEIVKSYVVLGEGYSPSEDIKEDIRQFVRDNLAKHAYPREITFIDELPKTASGKIKRHELRETESSE